MGRFSMEARKISVLVSRLICLLFIFSNFGHIVGAGVQKQASASAQQPASASDQNQFAVKSVVKQPFKVWGTTQKIAFGNLGANRRVGSGMSAEIERPATNKNIITKLHGIFKKYWYVFIPVIGAGALLACQFKNKSDAQKLDNKQQGGALQPGSLKLTEEQQALCEKLRQARDKLVFAMQSRKNSLREQHAQGKITEAQLSEQENTLNQVPDLLDLERDLKAATEKLRALKNQSVQSGVVAQEPEIPVSRPKLTKQEYLLKLLGVSYESLKKQEACLGELHEAGGISDEEVKVKHGELRARASQVCEEQAFLLSEEAYALWNS